MSTRGALTVEQNYILCMYVYIVYLILSDAFITVIRNPGLHCCRMYDICTI